MWGRVWGRVWGRAKADILRLKVCSHVFQEEALPFRLVMGKARVSRLKHVNGLLSFPDLSLKMSAMGRTSDSRQRLMDAASALIWGYSYGAVTIEAICDRAKVKKGSFYYFFDSKTDLAVAAVQAWFDERKRVMEPLLPPGTPPLERMTRYMQLVVENQMQAYRETGQVLGCPIFTLGSEISTQDDRLRTLVQEILVMGAQFFEAIVRDAMAAGDIDEGDVALKSRQLWSFYEGTLTRARIENDPELLRHLSSDALALLGARQQLAAA